MAHLNHSGIADKLEVLANGLKSANLLAPRAADRRRSSPSTGGVALYVQQHLRTSIRLRGRRHQPTTARPKREFGIAYAARGTSN